MTPRAWFQAFILLAFAADLIWYACTHSLIAVYAMLALVAVIVHVACLARLRG